MEEQDIFKRIRDNDGQAFEMLFRKYFISLRNYAVFYTGDSQMAEDIVHDVFYKIWEQRRKLEIHSSIKAYLYRSVHNKSIQYLRHQKVVNEYSRSNQAKHDEAVIMNKLYFETGLGNLFENEISDLENQIIAKLKERTREIYILSRKHHKSYSEIAEKLNIEKKTVEYHISKAISLLREELKDYF